MESIHAGTEAYLFKSRPAIRFRAAERASPEHLKTAGEPAPRGATLYYWLKAKPASDEEISLEILDSAGKTIRKFTNHAKSDEKDRPPADEDSEATPEGDTLSADAGLNRFAWDLRFEKPRDIPGTLYDDGDPRGAFALPGTYEVKLTVAGKTYSQPLELRPDPRVKAGAADLAKQFDLVTEIGAMLEKEHAAVIQIRSVRAQMVALKKRLEDDEAAQPIRDAATEIDKKMTPIEEELIEPKATASEDMLNYPAKLNSKLGHLQAGVDAADAPPTQQQLDLAAQLEKDSTISSPNGKMSRTPNSRR